MILALIVISAILFFIFFVVMSNRFIGNTLAFVAIVILGGSLFMLVQNDKNDLGMTKVTSEKQTVIFTAGDSKSPVGMLLYQQVGTNGKDNVYIYKASKNAKKPSHTQADEKTTNIVKFADTDTATLDVTTVKYEYKKDLDKFLFGIGGNDGKVIKRTNVFTIPKDTWAKLSVTAAKKMAKTMAHPSKKAQAAQKKAAEAYIGAKMKAAMMADPTLATSESRQQALIKQATAEFQLQAIKDAIKKAEASN
jgi:hypothetical protein